MNPVADVLVKVKGIGLTPATRRDLMEVTVHDDLNMASMFTLKLHSWDDQLLTVTWPDRDLFAIGGDVEIQLGYNGALTPVIAGEITELAGQFAADASPVLTVTGQDYRHRLGRTPITVSYAGMTDAQIASAVIGRNSLTADVPATENVRETGRTVTQRNETDLAFLHRLAGDNDFEVLIDGKTVYFGPPKKQPVPTALVLGNDQLIDFSATVSGTTVVEKVQVKGVDKNQKNFQSEATATAYPGTLGFDELAKQTVVSAAKPIGTKPEGDRQASAELADYQARLLSGSGSCRGDATLRAGRTVKISGVGQRFGGLYRVTSVSHVYSTTGTFQTSFQVNGSLLT